ncbi:Nonribosomal peptide synthase sidD-like protein [Elsinoe fawcettii]|nr:Nonribosomal peptide synthase sidD-like protein [Elsinoe fawcettii]
MANPLSFSKGYQSVRLPHPWLTRYRVEAVHESRPAQLRLSLEAQPTNGTLVPHSLHYNDLSWIDLASPSLDECLPSNDNSAWARARRSPASTFKWKGDAPSLGQIWNIVHAIYLAYPAIEYFRVTLEGAGADAIRQELLTTGLAINHPSAPTKTDGQSGELLILRGAFWQGAASPMGPRPIWVVGNGIDKPFRQPLSTYPIMPEVQHFTNRFPDQPIYTQHPVRRPKPYPGSIVYSRFIPEIDQHFSLEVVDWENADHLKLFNKWQNDPRVAKGWNETGTLDQHRHYLKTLHRDPHVLCLFGRFDEARFAYFELYWSKEDHYGAHYKADDYDRGRHSLVGDESFRGAHRVNAWYSSCIHYCFLDDPRTANVVGEPRATGGTILSYENSQGLVIGNLSADIILTNLNAGLAAAARTITGTTPEPLHPGERTLKLSSLHRSDRDVQEEELIWKLQVIFEDDDLYIDLQAADDNVQIWTISHIISCFVGNIHQLIEMPGISLGDCLRPTANDLEAIWAWNEDLPELRTFCMHDVIAQRASQYPNKTAIDAWDGTFSYAQIERYSSWLALKLQSSGVRPHEVVPICFEKSRWTAIAMLAVMKVGATFVMMEPSLPPSRLQNIAEQVCARVIVSSQLQKDLSSSIMPEGSTLVVSERHFESIPLELPDIPVVQSSTLMYLVFTSGSTGTPKGVKISHETYTSSAFPRAEAVGYTSSSRVLDFASYAFDVSIDSLLLTLANGGCLCIPSDEERMNDINGALRRMRVNYAGLTPSVARILDIDVVASMEALGLGGEASSVQEVNHWGQHTRIVIGYGPCECTIGCTVNSSAATGRSYVTVGPGNGSAIWVVDPDNHDMLLPVGAVGELLVEGPIVGQGYLNDSEKTASVFIEDPKWLVAGHGTHAGRRGRLYKTGDLGKYDPDGSGNIVFVGRKDTQVKLRGQRVELGEIESQLRTQLSAGTSVVVEIISPAGTGSAQTLVAFVASPVPRGKLGNDLELVHLEEDDQEMLSRADRFLKDVLPRYMVPVAYIPINYVPSLISGKIDRKSLKQFGSNVNLRKLKQRDTTPTSADPSENDEVLRKLWNQLLGLEAHSIQSDDSFFALGGTSVAAMKLSSMCRSAKLELSVGQIFTNQTLSSMAACMKTQTTTTEAQLDAFALLPEQRDVACRKASLICGCPPAAVEDIYPCTPTQESLFTFSLKSEEPYVAQRVSRIPSHITTTDWKVAWESMVSILPIMRTRVAQVHEPGLQQIVLKCGIQWICSDNLAEYLAKDHKTKMGTGEDLARFAIVEDASTGNRHMIWTVHHVLYDGWSEPLILEMVNQALSARAALPATQMKHFVNYVKAFNEEAMKDFWRKQLAGAIGPQFPSLPHRDYVARATQFTEHRVGISDQLGSYTLPTLIRGAWALVVSHFIGSDDVVFGETLSGRDIAIAGAEAIIGPMIATIPIRIHVNRSLTVRTYLERIQLDMTTRAPFQHAGMQNIRKVSGDAQVACGTGTGLVIQPESTYDATQLGFEQGDPVQEALHFNPYPLMLAFGLRKGGFRVVASFDESLVDHLQVDRMLAELGTTCQEMARDSDLQLGEVKYLPNEEIDQILRWNNLAPSQLDESSGALRTATDVASGSAYPRVVVPWVCNPHNPAHLSAIGTIGAVWLEGHGLPGTPIDAPEWLSSFHLSGSDPRGKLYPTADLGRLEEDGKITFIRHADELVRLRNNLIDVSQLRSFAARFLPSSSRIMVAVRPGSEAEDPLLLVLVHRSIQASDTQENGPSEKPVDTPISSPPPERSVVSLDISYDLVKAFKELDQAIANSLPPYMVPFTYLEVADLPLPAELTAQSACNQLASGISMVDIKHTRQNLLDEWAKLSAAAQLTDDEQVLRDAWSNILKLDVKDIDLDDNFFRLGGDSVLAMKLVSLLRSQGKALSVADVFQHMKLKDAAKRLKLGEPQSKIKQTYRPFSTVDLAPESDPQTILKSLLDDTTWSIRDVYQVTDSQALDVEATIRSPRTAYQYTTLHFNHDLDHERLASALRSLIITHDILRTIFVEYKHKLCQIVIDDLEIPITDHQTEGDIETFVHSLCEADIEKDFNLGQPFTRLLIVRAGDGSTCLVLGLSHAQYDGVSLPLLLENLEKVYSGSQIVKTASFACYVGQSLASEAQDSAIKYWRALLQDSSLYVVPNSAGQPRDRALFRTRSLGLSDIPKGFTFAALLSTAWGLTLSRRLAVQDVTFATVTSGRNIPGVDVDQVVGPCYQFMPVRIKFPSGWKATDLLQTVQEQTARSLAYDYLGFDRIKKHCTAWPEWTKFFDSVVHYQDAGEDYDQMPFAGSKCKVDAIKPHGDAAWPWKVVSYVKEGKTHIGVVGSERDGVLAGELLEDVVNGLQELIDGLYSAGQE